MRAAAAAAVAAVLLAGCSEEDSGLPQYSGAPSSAHGTTTPPAAEPSATTTSAGGVSVKATRPSDAREAAVYDAYLEFWRADVAAVADPTASTAGLSDRLVQPQRRRTLLQVEKLRTLRQRAVGSLSVAPSSIDVTQRRAVLRDCLDDSRMSLVDQAGEPVPDSAGSRQPVEVRLVSAGGGWKISDIQVTSGGC